MLNRLAICGVLLLLPLLSQAQGSSEGEAGTGPIYVDIKQNFLANPAGSRRFIQIKAEALVADPATQAALELHMPQIRHEILMLLSDTSIDQLKTAEDKAAFRAKVVALMKQVLEKYQAAAAVEDFYITSFILQ